MSLREIREHNHHQLQMLLPGDLVEFDRKWYCHWGVYLGEEKIGHLAGEEDDGINGNFGLQHVTTVSGVEFSKGRVTIDNFWKVADNQKAYKNNKQDKKWVPLDPKLIVENFMRKVGDIGYNVLWKNCEHFANWCRYGEEKSSQVDNVLTGVGVGVAGALALGVVYAFSKFMNKEDEEEERSKEKRRIEY